MNVHIELRELCDWMFGVATPEIEARIALARRDPQSEVSRFLKTERRRARQRIRWWVQHWADEFLAERLDGSCDARVLVAHLLGKLEIDQRSEVDRRVCLDVVLQEMLRRRVDEARRLLDPDDKTSEQTTASLSGTSTGVSSADEALRTIAQKNTYDEQRQTHSAALRARLMQSCCGWTIAEIAQFNRESEVVVGEQLQLAVELEQLYAL